MVDVATTPTTSALDDLHLETGQHARLYRLMYQAGPANGTLLFLPYDHGIEHGPIDFLGYPQGADPSYIFRLAARGRFSGIATHLNLARRYYPAVAGQVPLVVKLNGKTAIPPDDQALSPMTGDVESALRLGADAVGYTLYVGSAAQDRDFEQLREVRREANRLGVPLIVWAYPRGEHVEAKGGRDALYAIDYAARVALELGADVIKLNIPKHHKEGSTPPEQYRELEDERFEMTQRVIASAQGALVVFTGGSFHSDEELLADLDMVMRAGASGIIAGRNIFQRTEPEALSIVERVHELLGRYPR